MLVAFTPALRPPPIMQKKYSRHRQNNELIEKLDYTDFASENEHKIISSDSTSSTHKARNLSPNKAIFVIDNNNKRAKLLTTKRNIGIDQVQIPAKRKCVYRRR